jgi:hypothetical protein
VKTAMEYVWDKEKRGVQKTTYINTMGHSIQDNIM